MNASVQFEIDRLLREVLKLENGGYPEDEKYQLISYFQESVDLIRYGRFLCSSSQMKKLKSLDKRLDTMEEVFYTDAI